MIVLTLPHQAPRQGPFTFGISVAAFPLNIAGESSKEHLQFPPVELHCVQLLVLPGFLEFFPVEDQESHAGSLQVFLNCRLGV